MIPLCRQLLFLILCGLFCLSAGSAVAQGPQGRTVLFLTEVVEAAPGVEEMGEINFWWSSADSPDWTRTDEVVFSALRGAGVEPLVAVQTNISRIYRRPHLSHGNAAQLGALLEAERVLVGSVEYHYVEPLAPLALQGVRVRAEVDLVSAGSADGVSLQRFVVERKVFARSLDGLLERARFEAGDALGEVLGHGLKRSAGHVGISSQTPLLALRNVERSRYLEAVRARLLELDEVHAVRERWASEGVIALEVNPGDDDAAALEYFFRVLEHHDFEEFRVLRNDRPVAEGTVEFWIEPRQAGR